MSEDATPIQAGLPEITQASVKVMRSHDYCHFEVQLSTSFPSDSGLTEPQIDRETAWRIAGIDRLRKTAARLVDKAVEQYKTAKAHYAKRGAVLGDRWEREECKKIEEKPETERTPEEQARLKDWKDRVHVASLPYDYEDDFDYQGD